MGLNDINTHDYETHDDPTHTHINSDEIQLSDRVTNTVVKGLDHPSFFAKGCDVNDTTGTGAYIEGTTRIENKGNIDEETNSKWKAATINDIGLFQQESVPHDDSNTNANENETTTQENELEIESESVPVPVISDEDRTFIASDSFDGKKDCYMFRRGDKGVGYYSETSAAL